MTLKAITYILALIVTLLFVGGATKKDNRLDELHRWRMMNVKGGKRK